MNILTFDTEEWFHLLDCDSTKGAAEWSNYECRIHQNVDRILNILEETDTKATFFIIGWVAEKYPEVVRKIAEKYEIGSHTMNHQLVWEQNRDEFKEDVSSSIKILEDVSGQKIKYFRAPGFSIRESEPWAFEVLSELGIEIDCSVFPAAHAHGGMPSYKHIAPAWIEGDGFKLKELPISPVKIGGKQIVYSGGGYFRLFPYSAIRKFTKDSDYVMSYIHPRDLDAGQPMLKELSLARRFKSYVGLKGAENKLRKWLTEFEFVDIHTANNQINWTEAQTIKL
ncbi:MAG: polysaccharide deacetylase family protein [Rikenellaceae bacterium]